MYLTFIPELFAGVLIELIGEEAWSLRNMFNQVREKDGATAYVAFGLEEWEQHLLKTLNGDNSLSATEREVLIMARRGQGLFKQNVLTLEKQCRVTKVDRIEHLRASHIKPWRDCKNRDERLAGENGLLLTPTIDHLFDRGFISFENNGELLISPAAHEESLQRMGVETEHKLLVGSFRDEQKHFLDFHRDSVFLKAGVTI